MNNNAESHLYSNKFCKCKFYAHSNPNHLICEEELVPCIWLMHKGKKRRVSLLLKQIPHVLYSSSKQDKVIIPFWFQAEWTIKLNSSHQLASQTLTIQSVKTKFQIKQRLLMCDSTSSDDEETFAHIVHQLTLNNEASIVNTAISPLHPYEPWKFDNEPCYSPHNMGSTGSTSNFHGS